LTHRRPHTLDAQRRPAHSDFARSKDVDNLLEQIALLWWVSKANATDHSKLPYFDRYLGTLLYIVRKYEPHRLDAQTRTAFL